MSELGYQKVDMKALNKKQLAEKPCTTCPMKSAKKNSQKRQFNSENEIIILKNQISEIEQKIKVLEKDKDTDPAVLQKYRTAILKNLEQINYIKNQSALKKLK